jgi:hypothetical protein
LELEKQILQVTCAAEIEEKKPITVSQQLIKRMSTEGRSEIEAWSFAFSGRYKGSRLSPTRRVVEVLLRKEGWWWRILGDMERK